MTGNSAHLAVAMDWPDITAVSPAAQKPFDREMTRRSRANREA